MGGINCPPRQNGAMGGNEIVDRYVKGLARYCEFLFDGSAKFFDANVAIETSVNTGDDLATAIQLLGMCEDALSQARSQLGDVAAVWSSVRAPEVDFGEQQKLITGAMAKVAVARLELQALAISGSLQQSLWQDPALTSAFVAAMESLGQTTRWQAKFAQAFATANLVAA